MLTEAVFPFYITHQTIIVVTACLMPWRLHAAIDFAILVPVTALGWWLFYRIGREVPALRVLIGLRGWVAPRHASAREAPAS